MTHAVERAYRDHWGRLVALLTDKLGSLELAEDCASEAFAAAMRRWSEDGVPARPDGWLFRVALHRGIDAVRRTAVLDRKLVVLASEAATHPPAAPDLDADEPAADETALPDHRLRLLFTCCHPALALDARVALTLRLLGGLRTGEIARAFLVSEAAMAARITRAKKRIAAAGIAYRVPRDVDLPARLPAVLAVLYLIFGEGYTATAGPALVRPDLAGQAIGLARVLYAAMPDEPEVAGLLALMLLQHARHRARVDMSGRLVRLAEQDRTRWDRAKLAEGQYLLDRAAQAGRAGDAGRANSPVRPGPYRLQAAIAAVHAAADRPADTDWVLIRDLYGQLEAVTGSPVVRLNRAVATAEVDGPAAGLALLDGLTDRLDRGHLIHAVRADLLRRLGHTAAAAENYARAIDRCTNAVEREFLAGRLAELRQPAGQCEQHPPEGGR